MSESVLQIQGLTKRFGGFTALNKVDIHVNKGERVGLIGPNGSGKTTTINCIAGALLADEGTIRFQDTDITKLSAHQRTRLGISRSFQIPKPFTSMTVLENLAIPLDFAMRKELGPGETTQDAAMEILGLVNLQDKAEESSNDLTQIDMRKLDLARAMAASPDLLISDEAMAGLSTTEVDDILQVLMNLNERGIAIIMVEHIMRAVMSFSERIVVLDAGVKIAEGTPKEVQVNPEVERAYLGE
jgi:branched-chain amino acid transport system ATP-binding protein